MVCWSTNLLDEDASLRALVEDKIAALRRQSLREVHVDADHGAVTLSGRVGSYYERQLILAACDEVSGVVDIVDQVVVQ